jgi:general secretion pathway protein A
MSRCLCQTAVAASRPSEPDGSHTASPLCCVCPVLLIDEAQLVSADCLTELRILQSDHFDSQSLLFTIQCGDGRLPERFRSAELLPLGSRIGPRLPLSHLSSELVQQYLVFTLDQAGCPHLITPELIATLAAHGASNLRVLNNMAAELLAAVAQPNLPRIEETLFFSAGHRYRRSGSRQGVCP